jgi:hypothetical protein
MLEVSDSHLSIKRPICLVQYISLIYNLKGTIAKWLETLLYIFIRTGYIWWVNYEYKLRICIMDDNTWKV